MLNPKPIAPLKLAVYADRLQQALKAAEAMQIDVPSLQIAQGFYQSQSKLVEPFIEQWAIAKLAAMIRQERRKIRPSDPCQLAFEESLGFTHLPRNLKTANSKPVERGKATVGAFRELVERLSNKKSPARREAEAAVALMEKYTAKEPRITWAEVCLRESE